jgi:hypothetical protein
VWVRVVSQYAARAWAEQRGDCWTRSKAIKQLTVSDRCRDEASRSFFRDKRGAVSAQRTTLPSTVDGVISVVRLDYW